MHDLLWRHCWHSDRQRHRKADFLILEIEISSRLPWETESLIASKISKQSTTCTIHYIPQKNLSLTRWTGPEPNRLHPADTSFKSSINQAKTRTKPMTEMKDELVYESKAGPETQRFSNIPRLCFYFKKLTDPNVGDKFVTRNFVNCDVKTSKGFYCQHPRKG